MVKIKCYLDEFKNYIFQICLVNILYFSINKFRQSEFGVATQENLSDFYLSSWQRGESGVPMLLVRLAMAGVAVAVLVWAVAESPNPFFIIYLTNWGLIASAMTLVCAVVVSISAVCHAIRDGNGVPPWYVGVYWVLCNICVTLNIVISLLYWALLYSPDMFEDCDRLCWLEFSTHTANAAVVLVELLTARTPVRVEHIYMPICVGFVYCMFTWIYYASGGTDINGSSAIYDILDWDEPGRTLLFVVVALVVAGLLYLAVWGMAASRNWLSKALIRTL